MGRVLKALIISESEGRTWGAFIGLALWEDWPPVGSNKGKSAYI